MAQKRLAFALTLRPRDGVTEDDLSEFISVARRLSKYCYVMTEMDGNNRHIHAALYLAKACTKGYVNQAFLRRLPGLDSNERVVFQNGTKLMYNDDFVQNYLTKDDDAVVHYSNLPELAELGGFYPSQTEQAQIQASKAVDPWYAKMELRWKDYCPPGTILDQESILRFLYHEMCVTRTIKIIPEHRKVCQRANLLYMYICKLSVHPDYDRNRWAFNS